MTPLNYVEIANDEISLVTKNQNNDFNNYNSNNVNSYNLNTQSVNDNRLLTKTFVNKFHHFNERSRRDLRMDFYNKSNDLVKNKQVKSLNDNKITILDSVIVNKIPILDNELANRKHVDDEICKDTIVRFNQTLQSFLKVTVNGIVFNLRKKTNNKFLTSQLIKFQTVAEVCYNNGR